VRLQLGNDLREMIQGPCKAIDLEGDDHIDPATPYLSH